MVPAPRIEVATAADIAELVALRAEQGWHPNRALLAASLSWDGSCCFVIRRYQGCIWPRERIVAAAFALAADQIGVIGNVVVRPEYQRGGLGRAAMVAALAWQRTRGVRSVLLDATPAGQPLYRRLGFVPAGARSWIARAQPNRLQREGLLAQAAGLRAEPRPATELPRAAKLDRLAFGGDRIALVARMLEATPAQLYLAEDAAGSLLGYVVARLDAGQRAMLHVGPWVARSPAAAAALLAALLAPEAPWRAALAGADEPTLVASLPGYAPDALMLWQRAGGDIELDDLIMQLDFAEGQEVAPARGPRRRFALHPEWAYAWLSPMTF